MCKRPKLAILVCGDPPGKYPGSGAGLLGSDHVLLAGSTRESLGAVWTGAYPMAGTG